MASSPVSFPSLSLRSYLLVLKRRRVLIVVVTIVMTGLSMVPGLLDDPHYTATSGVRVASLEQEGIFRTDAAVGNNQSERAIDFVTEIEIIKSKAVRAQVLAQLPRAVAFGGPFVEPRGFSEVVEITITADDPTAAADIANTYADVYVEDRRSRSVEALLTKSAELRDQGAVASEELDSVADQLAAGELTPSEQASLQLRQATLSEQVLDYNRRADELAVEASLRGRGTEVYEYAGVDLTPQRSGVLGAGAIGAVLGLLLGLALAVVVDLIQDRVASKDDLTGLGPDARVLATVPHANMRPPLSSAGTAVQEAFRYLRTGVRVFGLNARLRSLIVTSAVSAEGKSTTAARLASAMADAGDRVVLVDADLRRPSLHEAFDLPNDRGLSSVLVGDVPLDDALHFVRDNLAVLTAGPPVQDPPQMFGSEQFGRVLDALVAQSDFTILDSTPVLPVADALIAGQHVDGAIAVSRIGGVRRRAVRELLARLEEAEIPLIGLVANDSRDTDAYEGYDTGRYDDDRGGELTASAER